MIYQSFRQLLVAGGLWVLSASAFSMPAQGVWQYGRTATGQDILVRLVGNEHYSYFEDEYGHCYRQERNGLFAALTLWQVETQRQKANTLAQKMQQARREAERPLGVAANRPQRGPRKAGQYLGQRRGLVVLVDFDDVPFRAGHDNGFYDRVFNEEGLSMGRYCRSVRDYFLEQSYRQFDLSFDVYGPYRLSRHSSWYGENVDGVSESRHGFVAMEAAQQALKEIDDLSIYDWDGDGKVDQLCVVYAGLGQSSGGTSDDIWAHESTLTSQTQYGTGVKTVSQGGYTIDTYNICNELNKRVLAYNSSGRAIFSDEIIDSGIGVFCHEFGHCLGLPDLYASDGTVLGEFDIMDKASLDEYFQPAGYSAYERWYCGWLEPVELNRSRMYSGVKPLELSGEAFVLYCDNASRNEYYLFENRQKIGTDAMFPSAGLYVTHIDYNASLWRNNGLNESTSGSHQRYVYVGANVLNASDVTKVCFPQGNINSISDNGIPRFTQYNGTHTPSVFTGHAVEGITQNADGTVTFRYVNKNEPEPTFAYERELKPGRYGTLVLQYPVERADLEGVRSLYTVKGYTKGADGKPASLLLSEVEGDVEAGVPYVFAPEDNATQLIARSWQSATQSVTKAQAVNGLTGTFDGFSYADLTAVLFSGKIYMLSDNKLKLCGANSHVGDHRAYINISNVPLLTSSEATAAKGVALGFGSDVALGIGLVEAGAATDGSAGGQQTAVFDLGGRPLPSPLPRGISIVGGRKVAR